MPGREICTLFHNIKDRGVSDNYHFERKTGDVAVVSCTNFSCIYLLRVIWKGGKRVVGESPKGNEMNLQIRWRLHMVASARRLFIFPLVGSDPWGRPARTIETAMPRTLQNGSTGGEDRRFRRPTGEGCPRVPPTIFAGAEKSTVCMWTGTASGSCQKHPDL